MGKGGPDINEIRAVKERSEATIKALQDEGTRLTLALVEAREELERAADEADAHIRELEEENTRLEEDLDKEHDIAEHVKAQAIEENEALKAQIEGLKRALAQATTSIWDRLLGK